MEPLSSTPASPAAIAQRYSTEYRQVTFLSMVHQSGRATQTSRILNKGAYLLKFSFWLLYANIALSWTHGCGQWHPGRADLCPSHSRISSNLTALRENLALPCLRIFAVRQTTRNTAKKSFAVSRETRNTANEKYTVTWGKNTRQRNQYGKERNEHTAKKW
jgi:hypothetical protein